MLNIVTKRFILRPLNLADKEMFCQLYTNKITMKYITTPYSETKVKKNFTNALRFNQNKQRQVKTWAVDINKASLKSQQNNQAASQPAALSNTIGIVMIYDEWQSKRLSTIEIGILLLHEATGKSYAKPTLSALLTYCFNELKLERVNIRFEYKNIAMATIAEQLGFKSFSCANGATNIAATPDINACNDMAVKQLTSECWQAHELALPLTNIKTLATCEGIL